LSQQQDGLRGKHGGEEHRTGNKHRTHADTLIEGSSSEGPHDKPHGEESFVDSHPPRTLSAAGNSVEDACAVSSGDSKSDQRDDQRVAQKSFAECERNGRTDQDYDRDQDRQPSEVPCDRTSGDDKPGGESEPSE